MGGGGILMSRFFVRKEDVQEGFIVIRGEDVHHIKNVLRLSRGSRLTVSDGNGTDYTVEISKMCSNCIYADIVNASQSKTEPPLEITLFQGVPKQEKMDFIIQKSVELGVRRIVPLLTERTVVRFGSERDKENRLKRWQRVAVEAAKQCNRSIVPEVTVPLDFNEGIKLVEDSQLSFIAYEKESDSSLKNYFKTGNMQHGISKAAVIIGPEGGFSEQEIDRAISLRAVPITLGPRIFRTETAGLVVLSIIMYELGDIG